MKIMKRKNLMSLNNDSKLERLEMRQIMAGLEQLTSDVDGLRCAKNGEQCPAPGAKYDGCCEKCNMDGARPSQTVFYCK
jgi:hypothetical protein